MRNCVGCGTEFPVSTREKNKRRWCSEACRVATHRVRIDPLNLGHEDAPASVGDYRAALLEDPCAYCGAEAEELDHVEPRARLGRNHWSNLTAACRRCNAQKNKRSLLAFLLARPLFPQRDAIEAELRLLT